MMTTMLMLMKPEERKIDDRSDDDEPQSRQLIFGLCGWMELDDDDDGWIDVSRPERQDR